jgi:predicted GNAT family N-acyltransferase
MTCAPDAARATIIIFGMGSSFRVRRADWERDRERLRRVREAVFVREQKVPAALEWDGADAACLHVLAEDASGSPIGTGRLLPDGQIGRMAVLAGWRRRGVGSAILAELILCAAERGMTEVVLNAQTHALGFYQGHGFIQEGEVFLDAGIDHMRMRRVLGQTQVHAPGVAES